MQGVDRCATTASDEEDAEIEAAPSGLFWVAAYLTDRAYGGAEEGGWWYDASELATDPEIYRQLGLYPSAFAEEEAAQEYAARMSAGLSGLNAGRPPRHSVLSLGEYEVLVLQAPALPRYWPEARPHYE